MQYMILDISTSMISITMFIVKYLVLLTLLVYVLMLQLMQSHGSHLLDTTEVESVMQQNLHLVQDRLIEIDFIPQELILFLHSLAKEQYYLVTKLHLLHHLHLIELMFVDSLLSWKRILHNSLNISCLRLTMS